MINNRGTLHGGQGSSRCLGTVSGFLLKLIRESGGLTQVQLAEKLGVDVASVQGWESGRRPLAALRTVDLVRLRYRLLRDGAEPTLLAMLEDAIRADLIIAETVQGGGQLIDTDGHPLGATVHQRQLTNLITIAVGTAVAGGPPRRSQRAELPHWAPALGSGVEPRVGEWMPQAGGW